MFFTIKSFIICAGSKSNLFIDDAITEPDETVTALRYSKINATNIKCTYIHSSYALKYHVDIYPLTIKVLKIMYMYITVLMLIYGTVMFICRPLSLLVVTHHHLNVVQSTTLSLLEPSLYHLSSEQMLRLESARQRSH